MIDTNDFIARLEQSTASLLRILDGANGAELSQRPADAAWSALECIEHIVISEIGILRILSRPPDNDDIRGDGAELLGRTRIENELHDRSRRYTAPESAAPRGKYADATTALDALRRNRTRIAEMIESGAIRFDGATRSHPLMGEMTKIDWFNFLLAHADRHQVQIEATLASIRLQF